MDKLIPCVITSEISNPNKLNFVCIISIGRLKI